MNQVQNKVFQLLQVFTQVCEQLQMKYFLVCGSALGAVKYSGFIPWDDDVDVGLYREDYERFCQEAPQLLPTGLFLQNYRSEPYFPAIYSKLRNSNTTCIEASVAALSMNHGIALDIFPLDGYPTDKREQRRLERKKKMFVRMLSIPCIRTERWKENIVKPLRMLGVGRKTAEIAASYSKLISAWPVKDAEMIANHGNWQGQLEYHPKSVYGNGCWGVFEGMRVRLPADYDSYLRKKYGDYCKDPTVEKQKSHHRYLRLDPDHPYTDFFDEKHQRGIKEET